MGRKGKRSTRRNFLKQAALTSSLALAPNLSWAKDLISSAAPLSDSKKLHLSIFSKALQFLNYKDMSEAVKEMGFDGVDLTLRPKGHVLPEKVEEDLPLATEAIRSFGLSHFMLSTGIIHADDTLTRTILRTASQQGWTHYRTAWIKYNENTPVLETTDRAARSLQSLYKLNQTYGLKGGYQNHSGKYFGASIWDLYYALKKLPSEHTDIMGSQYDIMHAAVEGGKSWPVTFDLIKPHINSIVIKDFKWIREGGKWKTHYTPLGEGMVDLPLFFRLLKNNKIHVPCSLHVEYDLGGAEKGGNPSISHHEVFRRLKKDLEFARRTWQEA